MAQSGSVLASDARGRGFESLYLDELEKPAALGAGVDPLFSQVRILPPSFRVCGGMVDTLG